ncbi:MAG: hypothetical protein ACOCTU_06370 [Bacteroidota bacterium]
MVGTGMGPDVAKLVEMFGRDESIRRIGCIPNFFQV